MANFEIWHNPRCSKSRQTFDRLKAAGVEPEVVRYLEDPPSKAAIEKALVLLGLSDPRALMRTKEKTYRELGLGKVTAKDALITAMAQHPELIERPLVIKDGKVAVLGRPPENVDALL